MEEKVVKFDINSEKLLAIADARLDEGDYLSALRMLHKSLELYGAGADEYIALADAYDEMEIFELSAKYWFLYLDVCPEEEAVDAYEGLAACYYNMGNEPIALYYYNKMMRDKYVSPVNNMEMGELFEKQPRPRFKVSWPPERADYSDDIDEGLRALKKGEYAKAHEYFSRVHPQSEYYFSAQNYDAVCSLLEGKTEDAEACCRNILRQDEDNVQALSTYAAVLAEQDRRDESYRTAVKLASLHTDNPDELYKIATVCCENGLYEDAFQKFSELEKTVSYDLTLLYFKAIAAFKGGRVRESLASFGKILDIYPDAAVARHYFREIRRYSEEGGAVPETSFFYRVPKQEFDSRSKLLAVLSELPLADLHAYCDETDITELLEWAFDESDGQEFELQLAASTVAVRARLDSFVRELLLDPSVNDLVKFEILRRLCARNRKDEFGAVVGDIYRLLPIEKLSVGRVKHAKFTEAYALCFSRFAPLGEGSSADFCLAAKEVYAALERDGLLSLASGAEDLACAIYLTAVPQGVKKSRPLLQYLGADGKTVAQILSSVHGLAQEGAAASEAAAADAQNNDKAEDENETH